MCLTLIIRHEDLVIVCLVLSVANCRTKFYFYFWVFVHKVTEEQLAALFLNCGQVMLSPCCLHSS